MASGLLVVIFAINKLQDWPQVSLMDRSWVRFFMNASVVFYYSAWLLGYRSDLRAQEDVTWRLARSPRELQAAYLVFILGLAALFIFLKRAKTPAEFAGVFVIVLVWDLLGYVVYLKRILTPQFRESRRLAVEDGDQVGALDIDIVHEYMTGGWRLWRWLFGIIGAILTIAAERTGWSAEVPPSRVLSRVFTGESLVAAWVFVYLLAFEGWIWIFRLRRNACRAYVRRISHLVTKETMLSPSHEKQP
jgi:hypothetical protein